MPSAIRPASSPRARSPWPRSRATRTRHDGRWPAWLDLAADELRDRFDAAFWLPSTGFYAMALDGAKKPCASIGSNAGHALWSGIVLRDRAAQVTARMLEPDMFSGWGIRTYAAGQPG